VRWTWAPRARAATCSDTQARRAQGSSGVSNAATARAYGFDWPYRPTASAAPEKVWLTS
jgi:hypothetical protein